MVNPFEQTLQAGIVNPREQAALSMRDAGIGSLGARSTLPRFTNREEAIARGHGGHPDQLWDQKINRIISEGHQKQDRWEELGGPNYNIVPGKTLNMPQYPVLNKGKIGPGWLGASNKFENMFGIPATNQGYRVQQAGAFDFLEPYMPWYDKEQDEKRYKPYIDPEIEQDRLKDEAEYKAEWLSEYGPSETGEFYPDKILRDLYPQYFGGLDSEDLGMEQLPLEAKVNLQDVQERIGGDINWNKFLRDLESRGIAYGRRGGIMGLV